LADKGTNEILYNEEGRIEPTKIPVAMDGNIQQGYRGAPRRGRGGGWEEETPDELEPKDEELY